MGPRLLGLTGAVAATIAASCCVIPIALIALGLASSGLMVSMMRYEWLTLPFGVAGLAVAFVLYGRERRRCDTVGCRFVGRRATGVVLGLAAMIVMAALLLRVLPGWTSRILESVVG